MRQTPAIILGICSAIAATTAMPTARPPSEASMLVTGTLELNGDGSVKSYTVDHPEKLPASVADVIQKNAPGWKFQPPSDSEETTGKMTLRIVAKPIDVKRDSVNIAGATFGDVQARDGKHIRFNNTKARPFYPKFAFYSRETATVYVRVHVNRDGKAQEVFAEQVNLGAYANKSEMDGYRRIFAEAATKAIKEWTFDVPTKGKTADAPFWDVRIPVSFVMAENGGALPDDYGKWHVYVPGPRRQPPWSSSRATTSAAAPDAISNGSLQQLDTGLQLVSALDGG